MGSAVTDQNSFRHIFTNYSFYYWILKLMRLIITKDWGLFVCNQSFLVNERQRKEKSVRKFKKRMKREKKRKCRKNLNSGDGVLFLELEFFFERIVRERTGVFYIGTQRKIWSRRACNWLDQTSERFSRSFLSCWTCISHRIYSDYVDFS